MDMKELYEQLIREFLIQNGIKKVKSIRKPLPMFDSIVVTDDNTIKVYDYGMSYPNLLFDYTVDYAVCIAEMEKDLFCQKRNMEHNNYIFTFK